MWSRLPTLSRQINPVRYMSIASAQHVAGKKPTIGFIGLGHMGGHMAHNLMKAGFPLIVYDIAPAAINTITSRATALSKTLPHVSVRAVATPRHVAEECPIVITMLPSSPHVRSTYTSIDGILKASTAMNKLLIDSSTIDPGTAREVAGLAAAAGSVMVDAPVSGGVGGAEAGTLTFMVGGPTAAFEQAKPYLQLMGKNIVHCGDAGTGQVAKVCNNLILGISMIAVSEGMNLGVKLGMDPTVLAGIINTSSGRCWSSDTYNPCPGVMPNVPSSRGYTGGFGVDLMKKDMGLALMAAQQAGQKLPLGECSNSLYDAISQNGNGNKDFSYVYEYLRTLQK